MFKMFKKRQKKVFKVSFNICRMIDGNMVTFDTDDARVNYIEAETMEDAASIFAKEFFLVGSRAVYIQGIEELTIRR